MPDSFESFNALEIYVTAGLPGPPGPRGPAGTPGSIPGLEPTLVGFGDAVGILAGDAEFVFDVANKFLGLGNSSPTAALHIGSNANDGVQLDAAIYIDRDLTRNTAHSAHGLTDETTFNDTGVAQYASLDVKVTMVGNQNHLVGGQFRPRFEGANATISQYVAGWNTSIICDELTHHLDQMVHFSVGTDTFYEGSIDFEAGLIVGALDRANEAWAVYTTQNRSRLRGITSFFGSTTAAIAITAQSWSSTNGGQITYTTATPHGLVEGDRRTVSGSTPAGYNGTRVARAGTSGSTIIVREVTNPGASSVLGQVDPSNDFAFCFFGDENTGFTRRAADTFTIYAGGARALEISTSGISSFDTSDVEFFRASNTADSFIRDDRLLGVTRFHTINAATGGSATGAVASIGTRSGADDPNNEIALIAAGPDYNLTSDWLVQDGAALRSGTALSGGMSIAALAGGLRLYTANLALSFDHTTQAAAFTSSVTLASFLAGIEQAEPAAPAANGYRIFAKDTGGKTELMVRFASGASQQIAIEP